VFLVNKIIQRYKQMATPSCVPLVRPISAKMPQFLPQLHRHLCKSFNGDFYSRTVLFWVITQRVAVISYRRFGTL